MSFIKDIGMRYCDSSSELLLSPALSKQDFHDQCISIPDKQVKANEKHAGNLFSEELMLKTESYDNVESSENVTPGLSISLSRNLNDKGTRTKIPRHFPGISFPISNNVMQESDDGFYSADRTKKKLMDHHPGISFPVPRIILDDEMESSKSKSKKIPQHFPGISFPRGNDVQAELSDDATLAKRAKKMRSVNHCPGISFPVPTEINGDDIRSRMDTKKKMMHALGISFPFSNKEVSSKKRFEMKTINHFPGLSFPVPIEVKE